MNVCKIRIDRHIQPARWPGLAPPLQQMAKIQCIVATLDRVGVIKDHNVVASFASECGIERSAYWRLAKGHRVVIGTAQAPRADRSFRERPRFGPRSLVSCLANIYRGTSRSVPEKRGNLCTNRQFNSRASAALI